jgi:hypothetical protein
VPGPELQAARSNGISTSAHRARPNVCVPFVSTVEI